MRGMQDLLFSPAIQSLGWALFHFIWQGVLIALLLKTALELLRLIAADIRYATAWAIFLLMPAVFTITAWTAYRSAYIAAEEGSLGSARVTAGLKSDPGSNPTRAVDQSSEWRGSLHRIRRLVETPPKRRSLLPVSFIVALAAGTTAVSIGTSDYLTTDAAHFASSPITIAAPDRQQERNRNEELEKLRQHNLQYRISKMDLKGMSVFSRDELLAQIPLRPGELFDIVKLKRGLVRIQGMYEDRGYINFSYVPEQDFNQSEKTVELQFTLDEGIPYYISGITFSGRSPLDMRLREAVTPFLEDGHVFRPAALDAAIAAVNKLQTFKKIDRRDCRLSLKEDAFGPTGVVWRLHVTSNRRRPHSPE